MCARTSRRPEYEPPPRVWLTPMATVERKKVNWLWPGRVPLGKVTLLVGDPGQGKSLLSLDIAARVTTGAAWPDQIEPVETAKGQVAREEGPSASGAALVPPPSSPDPLPPPSTLDPRPSPPATPCPVGSVILMSAEDDVADTIRPRLEVAGADITRVTVLRAIARPEMGAGELQFSLARDVRVLEAVIQQLPDVRLVILDPVSAYLAGADANSNTAIRAVLAPLKGVAERTGVAVLAISHLTKKADAALLYRTMGSLAFVAAARAVWAVGPDRAQAASAEAPGRRLFLPVKCNLAAASTGLAYRVVPSADDPDVPRMAWEDGAVPLTAEDALGVSAGRPSRRDTAAKWLEGLLTRGPLAVTDVERMAVAAGFSVPTLRRARQALGVLSSHSSLHAPRMLRLPGEAPEQPHVAEAPQAVGAAT